MYTKIGYFLRSSQPSSSYSAATKECVIQVPSTKDIEQMNSMPAGGSEDQRTRLMHMTQIIKQMEKEHLSLLVTDTEHPNLSLEWKKLFAALKTDDKESALNFLAQIPKDDTVLQALLAVHTLKYVQQLVGYSIQAHANGAQKLNSDITITSGTFEVLVKDMAATLFSAAKTCFSFGLPTHHAFDDKGSGFCVLDKTSILIKYIASKYQSPLKIIIAGTDVNRDNGLSYNLHKLAIDLDICHLDAFDSRVYPRQNYQDINTAMGSEGKDAGRQIRYWHQGTLNYFAVDLSLVTRKKDSLHPALAFILEKIEEQMSNATIKGHKIALFLPTGWDSHEEETADCGKYIDGQMMSAEEARKTRFSDEDLRQFYERIFELYNEHKESIVCMYWGLEGGYSRPMYEKQIQLMLSLVLEKLIPQDESRNTLGRL
ncbi:MAG: acetylpolyamine aminohydrolase [Legionella sp.]|nr:acetylpolyamine aminohydrolase [Legionella sp.]